MTSAMKVAVLGMWHLGTVTAACVATAGIRVVGIDDDAERVAGLARGEPPLFEPRLAELLRTSLDADTFSVATDPAAAADADVVWVCHDTPVDDQDRADVAFVVRRVEALFDHLKDGAVVLVSTQLPVGSIRALEHAYAARQRGRSVAFACSPENLRLGQAIQVFQNPGRIVVGVRDQRTKSVLDPLLRRFCDNLIWMSVESAEMVKHALNAFLATSITFTNEIATICERVGADASEVEAGLRSDPRIGQRAYVKAGPSFAGGTLARDVNFLDQLARQHRLAVPVIGNVLASNRAHGQWALGQLRHLLGPLEGKTVAILGLAYKPGTSTLRRSTAIELVRALLQERVAVRAFDPRVAAMPDDLAAQVTIAPDAAAAVRGADALVVATEWPEFRSLSADDIANAMNGNIVLDAGRFLAANLSTSRRLRLYSVGRMA
jgi:UDPglucose 6-dehydrogenase